MRTVYLLTAVPMVACSANIAADVAASSPSAADSSLMTYVHIDTPNALGFSKVITGEGETHAEGVIDAKGVQIIAPRTSFLINDITDHTALVQNGRLFQFVDLSKGPVNDDFFESARGYEYAEPYRCGRALVQLNDRRFFIGAAGDPLFGEDYEFAETFHEDRALVMQDGRYRIIGTDGSTVASLPYDQVNPQSPWCWQVTRIKGTTYWSGFVDLNGKEITALVFDEVGYYDPEVKRIRVGKGDRFGFLDEHAQEVIKVQYEAAEVFDHGKARVVLNGREFFIDKDGTEVPE